MHDVGSQLFFIETTHFWGESLEGHHGKRQHARFSYLIFRHFIVKLTYDFYCNVPSAAVSQVCFSDSVIVWIFPESGNNIFFNNIFGTSIAVQLDYSMATFACTTGKSIFWLLIVSSEHNTAAAINDVIANHQLGFLKLLLTMQHQMVCSPSYFHIRALHHCRSFLDLDISETFVCAVVGSCLRQVNFHWQSFS